MSRRVLVTGGAGFIGSNAADALLADGWTVEIIDNLVSGRKANLPAAAKFHELDIRSPEAADVVRNGNFDALVHLAAQIDVRRSVTDTMYDADVNVRGSLNLLEAARSLEKRPRIVFSSTGGAVYGDHVRPPNKEPMTKEPDSPYAIGKLTIENYLAYYGRIHNMESVTLRFANVYGPRQDPHGEAGVVAIFCTRLLSGQPLTIFGNGEQTRDYVFVGDVVASIVQALKLPLSGVHRIDERAFNIGTGVPTSVLQLADALKRATAIDTPIQFAPHRPGELLESYLDISKAKNGLQWSPKVSLEEGLRKTYDWFVEHVKGTPAS